MEATKSDETEPKAGPSCENVGLGDSASSGPICLIVLGMAGSGKTTFVKKLTEKLYSTSVPPYVVNLDPACLEVPYPCNVGKYSIIPSAEDLISNWS